MMREMESLKLYPKIENRRSDRAQPHDIDRGYAHFQPNSISSQTADGLERPRSLRELIVR